MKLLLSAAVALTIATPRIASAQFGPDPETSTPVSRLGDGMRGRMYRPPIIRFELLARTGSLQLSNSRLIADAPGQFVSDGSARIRGGGLRMLLGYGALYGGFEFSGVAWSGGPATRLLDAPVALSTDEMSTASAGHEMEGLAVVGVQGTIWPLLIGGELGLGGQLGWTNDAVTDAAIPSASYGGGTIQLRARAGIWLTRHISLVATLGTDLLDTRERQFGLSLGFSLGPWDGQR